MASAIGMLVAFDAYIGNDILIRSLAPGLWLAQLLLPLAFTEPPAAYPSRWIRYRRPLEDGMQMAG
eukprot:scaffold3492_cov26-Prasinocladus_malaysianus.AAC.1